MNGKRIRKPLKPTDRPRRGRADIPHLRVVSEAEILRTSPPELRAIPSMFWEDAELVSPVPKQPISLRIDEDVLAWFRKQGPRYQSRINAVLRSYMRHASPRTPAKKR